MKSYAPALRIICLTISFWQGYAIAEDDSKQRANEAIQRMTFFRDEAAKLSSAEIFKELERQRNILALKSQAKGFSLLMDDDSFKSSGYAAALEDRQKNKEPSGAFYFGVYNWRLCSVMQGVDKGQLGDTVKDCWLQSLESFKLASSAQIPAASLNIARLYENGWGVAPSKLVAAEWYVKAANQYNGEGSRDEALSSVEAALNLVPDHPAALKLRSAMLK